MRRWRMAVEAAGMEVVDSVAATEAVSEAATWAASVVTWAASVVTWAGSVVTWAAWAAWEGITAVLADHRSAVWAAITEGWEDRRSAVWAAIIVVSVEHPSAGHIMA